MRIRDQVRHLALTQPGRFVVASSGIALLLGVIGFGLAIRGQRGAPGVVFGFAAGLAVAFAVLGRRTYRDLRARSAPATADGSRTGR